MAVLDQFQFPPLREGRRNGLSDFRKATYFNSRPSARGDCFRACQRAQCRYFNSRPSARGDGRFCSISPHLKISIHAPPRGATQPCAAVIKRVYFNSRPSARGDPLSMRMRRTRYSISIHAPPRGATVCIPALADEPEIFQFTLLREGRRAAPAPAQSR